MKIKIDSKDYELNTQRAVELGVLTEIKPKVYSIGQRFSEAFMHDEYLLAQVDDKRIALIGLDNGNRWSNSVKVGNPNEISELEFAEICGETDRFTLKN